MHQAFVLTLKEGALDEYIRHHREIPTAHSDLAEALVASGVTALRIFIDGERLILCVEVADDQSMHRLWATEAHRGWSNLMEPLILLGPSGVPAARFLEQAYEFEA